MLNQVTSEFLIVYLVISLPSRTPNDARRHITDSPPIRIMRTPSPVPRTSVAWRQVVLHMYRQLLREASYLPPPLQPWVSTRMRALFRKHSHFARDSLRATQHLGHAGRALRNLRAANAGHVKCMRALAMSALGRTGARRRELMSRVVAPPVARSSEELEESLAAASERKERLPYSRSMPWLQHWNTSLVLALANAQRRQQNLAPSSFPSTPISSPTGGVLHLNSAAATIAAENSWGRPMPRVRVANATARWWKHIASKIAPPVGRDEWDLLERLATGKGDGARWTPGPRRSVAVLVGGAKEEEMEAQNMNWDWQAYATLPVQVVERKRSRSQKVRWFGREGDPARDPDDQNPYETAGPSPGMAKLTPRRMQRLWREVWDATPFVVEKARENLTAVSAKAKDGGKDSWKMFEVTFGLGRGQLSTANIDEAMFQGVDAHGKLPKVQTARKSRE